jgi:general secretion pathway protein K
MNALKDKKGMVLILVLSVVALFTAMIVSFSADESQDIELAYNFHDSLQAQYIARAGVEAATAIITEDDPSYDSLDEKWANFNELAALSTSYLEGTQFTGNITDECSKFDLNSLVQTDQQKPEFNREQFKKLFKVLKIDIPEEELDDLASAVIDWLDTDGDITGTGGAEEEYYQSLEPPYHCKNGPMDSPEEILLVRGMKPEYFFGTENYEGIGKYVTVNTGGKININTASEAVLESLSERFNEDVVSNILDCRPFKDSNNFSCVHNLDLSDNSPESTWIKNTLVVSSKRFSANMKGVMPSGALVNVKAVLDRINNPPRIVYYRIY